MPPNPATAAIQAPASDAMWTPSRELCSRSSRSISAASIVYSKARSSWPTSAAMTDCVQAESEESRTVIAS